jgi:hypothetical protein
MERDPRLEALSDAIERGADETVVDRLVALSGEFAAHTEDAFLDRFSLRSAWREVIETYPPARSALEHMRDAQVQGLLAGDALDLTGWSPRRDAGFDTFARMNEMLGELRATRDLFVRLLDEQPHVVARSGGAALPALVDAGDFALAERYLGNPRRWLDIVNETVRHFPLWPVSGEAPRLATELHLMMQELHMRSRIWKGLGREQEARDEADAVIGELATDELRALARAECVAPGYIMQTLVQQQVARHEATLAAGES